MTQAFNSPITHAVGSGLTGVALSATGNIPGAAIAFGIMGSKILDISGGYTYLKNQTFSVLGLNTPTKETETPK